MEQKKESSIPSIDNDKTVRSTGIKTNFIGDDEDKAFLYDSFNTEIKKESHSESKKQLNNQAEKINLIVLIVGSLFLGFVAMYLAGKF